MESGVGEDKWLHYYGEDVATAGRGKGAQVFQDISKSLPPGQKFEDPHFPANDTSLGELNLKYSDGTRIPIEWHRAPEIAKALFNSDKPIFSGGYDQFGVNQGAVGDCWFLAVLADVAKHPGAINILVPQDNTSPEFKGFEKGIFHFRFWFRGEWVDVPVDDRLPCIMYLGKITNTAFTKPTEKGGFWAPLLEKAYAKLYGDYNAIAGGFSVDAMKDFTGGFIITWKSWDVFDWEDKIKKYCNIEKILLAVGTLKNIPLDLRAPPNPNNPGNEIVSKEGIVCAHSYSLLGLEEVTNIADPTKKTTLVRLRNPWGNETEWNGQFSDKDTDGWNQVTPNLRANVSDRKNDGEFYMPVQKLANYISSLDVCIFEEEYRGVCEKKVFDVGTQIDQYKHIFPKANTGARPTNEELFKRGGYLIRLSPPNPDVVASGTGTKCTFLVNMLYTNFKKSGNNPHIPAFGFYQCYAPGKVEPVEFARACQSVELKMGTKGGHRDFNYYWNQFEAGTVLLVPWIEHFEPGMEDKTEYVFRAVVEGKIDEIGSLI